MERTVIIVICVTRTSRIYRSVLPLSEQRRRDGAFIELRCRTKLLLGGLLQSPTIHDIQFFRALPGIRA
jgi:hypothetical protein